jgi:hypothetical protein
MRPISLVLQLHLTEDRVSFPIVTALGDGLMVATPIRPVPYVLPRRQLGLEQGPDERSDLSHAHADDSPRCRLNPARLFGRGVIPLFASAA